MGPGGGDGCGLLLGLLLLLFLPLAECDNNRCHQHVRRHGRRPRWRRCRVDLAQNDRRSTRIFPQLKCKTNFKSKI